MSSDIASESKTSLRTSSLDSTIYLSIRSLKEFSIFSSRLTDYLLVESSKPEVFILKLLKEPVLILLRSKSWSKSSLNMVLSLLRRIEKVLLFTISFFLSLMSFSSIASNNHGLKSKFFSCR
jgi:hypothetical protein